MQNSDFFGAPASGYSLIPARKSSGPIREKYRKRCYASQQSTQSVLTEEILAMPRLLLLSSSCEKPLNILLHVLLMVRIGFYPHEHGMMVEKPGMVLDERGRYPDHTQCPGPESGGYMEPPSCMGDMPYPDPSSQHVMGRTMPVINKLESPSFCAGCGVRILERHYLLAVDKQWHTHCLKCSECKIRLDSELTCFSRDGNIYCKEDYYRRFAVKRCSRCGLGITANELVMRAKDYVYHLQCFTCASCNKTLTTGDQFGMKENLVYCRHDYEILFQGEFFPVMNPGIPCGPGPHIPFYNGVGTGVQKGRPRKRKNLSLDHHDVCPPGMGIGHGDGPDRGGDMLRQDGYGSQPPPRQKRVRTSFKHHQLRTMKSYFALNHNPDAKDLKQLAQKTGLSKRVLQVWFQNARAKYRRNLLKSETDKPGQNGNQSEDQPGSPDDGKDKDNQSVDEMTELDDSQSADNMSDISSTPSLSDLHGSHIESDHSSSSLSDLFTNSINSLS
ncbi:hypothetical protein FSP39_013846 [Pinctada imbricata]|uniref:Uncharacterized protein n=1 Tax=Pinctada imbricata TaxID=66713 RepID=A0AA88XVG0_PINIB|nr:hypothetical protein FSP39_013846 [Pinctada imbricata]